MESGPPVLLAAQSFEYSPAAADAPETHVDEIVFRTKVSIKEIRIIHNQQKPHTNFDFVGCSSPSSFSFQAYALPAHERSSKYQKLTDYFQYNESQAGGRAVSVGVSVPVVESSEFVTNRILFRGEYTCLSVCVYGWADKEQQDQMQVETLKEQFPYSESSDKDSHLGDTEQHTEPYSPANSGAGWRDENQPGPSDNEDLENEDEDNDNYPDDMSYGGSDSDRDRDESEVSTQDGQAGNQSSAGGKRKASSLLKGKAKFFKKRKKRVGAKSDFRLFSARVVNKVLFHPWKSTSYSLLSFMNPDEGVSNTVVEENEVSLLVKKLQQAVASKSDAAAQVVEVVAVCADLLSSAQAYPVGPVLRDLVEALLCVVSRRLSVAALKSSLGLLETLLGQQSPAAVFLELNGVERLCPLIKDSSVISTLKTCVLQTIAASLKHAANLEKFATSKQAQLDDLSSYQFILSWVLESNPPARTFFAAKEVLELATLFEGVSIVPAKCTALCEGFGTANSPAEQEHLVLDVVVALQRLQRLLESENSRAAWSREEDDQRLRGEKDKTGEGSDKVHLLRRAISKSVPNSAGSKKMVGSLPPRKLLPEAMQLPAAAVALLKHHKILPALTSVLKFQLGRFPALKSSVFSAVAPILLTLTASSQGLAFLTQNSADFEQLLLTLDPEISARAKAEAEEAAKSEAAGTDSSDVFDGSPDDLVSSYPYSSPSLQSCLADTTLATGPIIADIMVQYVRALLLVRCITKVHEEDTDYTHLAACHILNLMSIEPAGAHAVAFALCELDVLASSVFLSFLSVDVNSVVEATPPVERKASGSSDTLESPAVAATASTSGPPTLELVPSALAEGTEKAQYAVGLMLVLFESDFFPLLFDTASPALLTALKLLSTPHASKQFKQQLVQTAGRLEMMLNLKDSGVRGLCNTVLSLLDTKPKKAEKEAEIAAAAAAAAGVAPLVATPAPVEVEVKAPTTVLACLGAAFALLSFFCFSSHAVASRPTAALGSGKENKKFENQRWMQIPVLLLEDALFSQNLLPSLLSALDAACEFFSKQWYRMKVSESQELASLYGSMLSHVTVMLSSVIARMQQGAAAKNASDALINSNKKLVATLLKVHSCVSSNPKYFPEFLIPCPSSASYLNHPVRATVPMPALHPFDARQGCSSSEEPLSRHISDQVARTRYSLAKSLSVCCHSGCTGDLFDRLFQPHSVTLPTAQPGSLLLLGDLLPPPLGQRDLLSKADKAHFAATRKAWRDVLQPLVAKDKLNLLLEFSKSSSETVNSALVRLLVRLVELGEDVGFPLMDRLVDLAGAKIFNLCSVLSKAFRSLEQQEDLFVELDNEENEGALYLVRLLYTITWLLANPVCQWLLNELGVVAIVRPLLQLKVPSHLSPTALLQSATPAEPSSFSRENSFGSNSSFQGNQQIGTQDSTNNQSVRQVAAGSLVALLQTLSIEIVRGCCDSSIAYDLYTVPTEPEQPEQKHLEKGHAELQGHQCVVDHCAKAQDLHSVVHHIFALLANTSFSHAIQQLEQVSSSAVRCLLTLAQTPQSAGLLHSVMHDILQQQQQPQESENMSDAREDTPRPFLEYLSGLVAAVSAELSAVGREEEKDAQDEETERPNISSSNNNKATHTLEQATLVVLLLRLLCRNGMVSAEGKPGNHGTSSVAAFIGWTKERAEEHPLAKLAAFLSSSSPHSDVEGLSTDLSALLKCLKAAENNKDIDFFHSPVSQLSYSVLYQKMAEALDSIDKGKRTMRTLSFPFSRLFSSPVSFPLLLAPATPGAACWANTRFSFQRTRKLETRTGSNEDDLSEDEKNADFPDLFDDYVAPNPLLRKRLKPPAFAEPGPPGSKKGAQGRGKRKPTPFDAKFSKNKPRKEFYHQMKSKHQQTGRKPSLHVDDFVNMQKAATKEPNSPNMKSNNMGGGMNQQPNYPSPKRGNNNSGNFNQGSFNNRNNNDMMGGGGGGPPMWNRNNGGNNNFNGGGNFNRQGNGPQY
mmetsp:Transcript_22176/g.44039  ORF Transcript_22176/g.44039 Transcript_22176/m.44039 type:complete len:1988 (+) Transcript_22176:32-5995(+)